MTNTNGTFIVPFYNESDLESLDNLKFPFSDTYLHYDKRKHQYFLTEEALKKYGVDVDDMDTMELNNFIAKVTRAVYSYIKVKAGTSNYAKMMYRIAKGLGAPNLTALDFRMIFLEDILIVQSHYMADGGYAKDMPKATMNETGRAKAVDLSENDGYWLHDDVITTLDSLNLTNMQLIRDWHSIDWEDY